MIESSEKKHPFWWWVKTAGQVAATAVVSFAPEILKIFPEHTLAFKLALPIGFAIKLFAMKYDYQKNSDALPSGVTSVMDKIPNSVTGIKNSKNVNYIGN